MTLTTYDDLEQRSDSWYEARCGLLTASTIGQLIHRRDHNAADVPCPACKADADQPCVSYAKGKEGQELKTYHPARGDAARETNTAPILEVATGDTARALTLSLAAERITGYVEPTYVNADMERGILDEPIAREIYAATAFGAVTEAGFMVRTLDNGARLGYSPDGLVNDNGLLEIKSRRQKKHLATVIADEVPVENMAQLQAGLFVTGREWHDYVSYCGGMNLYVKRVRPDPAWFTAIENALNKFEDDVIAIINTYTTRTANMPTTERIDHNLLGLEF